MAPKKVDKLITLKGAKLITLWRPTGGQTNNSPAYIYMCVCRRVISLSTFWPFRELLVCPPFCQNLILTAARSKLKAISLATRAISLSTFWVDIWPKNLDKLVAFEVAKLITFKWLYVFPYLGLFGPFFEKQNRASIERQVGTSVDTLITFITLTTKHTRTTRKQQTTMKERKETEAQKESKKTRKTERQKIRGSKSNKERKQGRKKTREPDRERDREKEVKEKARKKQRETLRNEQNALFQEKNWAVLPKPKRNNKNNKTNQNK